MAGLLTMSAPDLVAPDLVATTLRRWAQTPFDLATANCGLSVARFVEDLTGNALPPWLLGIGVKPSLRLMRNRTRFIAVARDVMRDMGCTPVSSFQRGDVGLVDMALSGLTAAICTGSQWAARGDHAVIIEPVNVVCGWRLPCRKR